MQSAADVLRHEISQGGPISFARFMEIALYHPHFGYYERPAGLIGRRGDFYTSVSVGSLFGELLAFQFATWLKQLDPPRDPRQIVEAGAHDGKLADDILNALEQHEPTLARQIRYVIIEPSPRRMEEQRRTLARFNNVQWAHDVPAICDGVHGVIFSNELLDAMPLHRLVWDAASNQWQELGVTVSRDTFAWTRLSHLSVLPPGLPAELLAVLPDGYIIELSPAARQWWREAAGMLTRGKLLAIDYGGAVEEMLSPSRTSGTLRGYSRHHIVPDVLGEPGDCDITAHVNFSEVRHTGESAGLITETFTTQSQFLTAVAREMWTARRSWPPEQVRQFQTLTHPEHLGRPFRVLVQSR